MANDGTHRSNGQRLLAALVVVSACAVAGVGIGAAASAPEATESGGQPTVVLGLLDGIQDFIEELDNFLESVADLMKTVQELFGGGEGGD
jgi:hypothetical protein